MFLKASLQNKRGEICSGELFLFLFVMLLICGSAFASSGVKNVKPAKVGVKLQNDSNDEIATGTEEKEEGSFIFAFELVYSENAMTPVSGSATEALRYPLSARFTGLTSLKFINDSIWAGGDVLLGGYFQSAGSLSASSTYLGLHLRTRALIGTRWKTPVVDVMPYGFASASLSPGGGRLKVAKSFVNRLQMPLGGEFGVGLWWNMLGFLLRLDLGAGFLGARATLSLSAGVGYAF